MATATAEAFADFLSIYNLSQAAGRFTTEELIVARPVSEVVQVVRQVQVSASLPSSTAAAVSFTATSPIAPSPALTAEEDIDIPLTESTKAEIRRLEATVHEVTEVNERIMAQNIALLADLEAAQRAVRDLRAEKDLMAQQLKLLMS